MSELLNPLNLILIAAAAFILWRLGGVLGQRTGHETPGLDPFAKPQPGPATEPVAKSETREPEEEPKKIWEGIAIDGSPVATGLEAIQKASPGFAVPSFLEGAKMAYEMVLEAYAKGDKPALKPLVSKEVFDDFAVAIDKRNNAGHTAFLQFVGVKSATIEQATLLGKRAQIAVRFAAEMINATTAADGSAVDGDPKAIHDVYDRWTFERDVTSRDPNWRLMDTSDD